LKVLIIGGKSAIGMELKKTLTPNYEVLTAGRGGCDFYLDLSAPIDFQIKSECDVVIHTAAKFGGDDLLSFEENVNTNVVGTIRAIGIAEKMKAKHFVLISSMSALQDSHSPFYSIYSITKRQSEDVADFVCQSIKIPLTILRPSQLYGDNDSFKRHQPLIYSIIDSAKNNKEITFYGKHDAIRNYLHIDDFNEIIRRVIDSRAVGKFNCVNTQNTSITQVAQAAIKAFNSKSHYSFDEYMSDIIDNSFEVDDLFFNKIDFKPRITIEKGMIQMRNSKGSI
jgi:UDP-glucose 4-epimerase